MSERPRVALFAVRDLVTGSGSSYSSTERLVALAIADYMSHVEGEAWPSRRQISAWTGLGETAVRTALKALADGDRAIFARQPGRIGRETYTYTLRAEGESTSAARPRGGSLGRAYRSP